MRRYAALRIASSLLKTVSVVVLIGGISFTMLFLSQTDRDTLDKALTVVGVLLSIVGGILLFAVAELFHCVMDIEPNTRTSSRSPDPQT